ncbi:MAG: Nif3-like dinuclear metal center hexameric protein [Sphaerochaeta sp.]|jgi:dinuclear metal center YbgI/SA1388 family protein|uniref:Nif3-like dinuclear metal center hexameric protein n=1 Tax=Sphaerochaeta sp. TaxID=1972642 RepID=UPI001DB4FCB3|nr:Nif3-like dinuclear metal center hexameric protein [uncultured Sphaerochaeta sp.]MDD3057671.1 Nif3-like dinuclear metal center hexameric protein [Sphaerochaeta sp.]MDD3928511.1 Nif3-like dinuclear metal center hexameric protein [Sphaerochaeta sp.]NCC11905.1 Nif3-like dinuclear metal center hexameric protein [Spirochaetia bacterium]NCC89389.1 Nif3-like dinuclear metal center hexameric protein [Spirochaetia bacterium]
MKRSELTAYLDAYLEIGAFEPLDRSLNGLVVAGEDREVTKVAFAVDACQSTFELAREQDADLLVVHHGLFWGSPIAVTSTHHRRLKTLIEGNLDLYVAHLPLDAHPQVGNNAVMAQKLGLGNQSQFAPYKGRMLGCKGTLEKPTSLDDLCKTLGFDKPVILAFGKTEVREVGIVSGGASDDVHEAIAEGLDVFITGEVEHQIYHEALEHSINVIGGGHYLSEVFGVQALMEHLNQKFGLSVVFVANPTGL